MASAISVSESTFNFMERRTAVSMAHVRSLSCMCLCHSGSAHAGCCDSCFASAGDKALQSSRSAVACVGQRSPAFVSAAAGSQYSVSPLSLPRRFVSDASPTVPVMASQEKYPAEDLKTKMNILEEVEHGVIPRTEIARKYDIKKSTLLINLKNKEESIEAFQEENMEPSRKRLRTLAHPELENAVVMWIKEVRSHNIPLSGPIIAVKAAAFSSEMGISDFGASEGWLSRFRARHGLTFRNVCGESAEVDQETCEQWTSIELKERLTGYSLNDVFNAN